LATVFEDSHLRKEPYTDPLYDLFHVDIARPSQRESEDKSARLYRGGIKPVGDLSRGPGRHVVIPEGDRAW